MVNVRSQTRDAGHLTNGFCCAILHINEHKKVFMRNWYLVTTKTGEQDRAEDNLGSQLFEVYNPKIKVDSKGESGYDLEPLFLDYMFVKFDPMAQSAATINSTRGVRRLVTFGNQLARASEDIIEIVRGIANDFEPTPVIKKELKSGQKVEILEGPFAGIQAIFKEPDGEKRSFLMIEMLGNNQRLSVSNKQFA